MSNVASKPEGAPAVPQAPRRQVALPGAKRQRRGGLLLLGLVLVAGTGLGFWMILVSVDQREPYLVAARTIERWEVVTPADFTLVEAYVGTASALTVDQLGAVLDKWATGRIPAGTLITEGLFETPPLSGENESDKVLIQVNLPAQDAPFGALQTGDRVALLGRESSDSDGRPGPLALIGVLELEFVTGDDIYYVVTPFDALAIKSTVERYLRAADRTIVKLGSGLAVEELVDALARQTASVPPAASEASTEAGQGLEPVEDP